ncbi:hypothetical protein BC628DRAFT_568540 [Trametes gibbosa]|nr:hypothetical protein BC628DRAFT_568540 [Trametes gibbosa]
MGPVLRVSLALPSNAHKMPKAPPPLPRSRTRAPSALSPAPRPSHARLRTPLRSLRPRKARPRIPPLPPPAPHRRGHPTHRGPRAPTPLPHLLLRLHLLRVVLLRLQRVRLRRHRLPLLLLLLLRRGGRHGRGHQPAPRIRRHIQDPLQQGPRMERGFRKGCGRGRTLAPRFVLPVKWRAAPKLILFPPQHPHPRPSPPRPRPRASERQRVTSSSTPMTTHPRSPRSVRAQYPRRSALIGSNGGSARTRVPRATQASARSRASSSTESNPPRTTRAARPYNTVSSLELSTSPTRIATPLVYLLTSLARTKFLASLSPLDRNFSDVFIAYIPLPTHHLPISVHFYNLHSFDVSAPSSFPSTHPSVFRPPVHPSIHPHRSQDHHPPPLQVFSRMFPHVCVDFSA